MSEQQLFYTVQQIAKRWQVDAEEVPRIFRKESGVLDLGTPADVRKRKRAYRILRVPANVLARVERNRVVA